MFVANITIIPLVMAQAMLCETIGDDTHDTDTGIPDTGVPGTRDTPPVPVHTPNPVSDTVMEIPAVRSSVRIESRAGRGK